MAYDFAIAAGRAHRGASWLPITIFPMISGPGDPGCPLAFHADTTVKQAVRFIYNGLWLIQRGCECVLCCTLRAEGRQTLLTSAHPIKLDLNSTINTQSCER